MSTNNRNVHLVGSLPYNDETEAMRKAIQIIGQQLYALPDGEIGEKSDQYPNGCRSAWTQIIMDGLEKDTENWVVKKAAKRNKFGFPVHYTEASKIKPKRSPGQVFDCLDFHWLDYFKSSYPKYQKLKQESGLKHLKFQAGLPTGLGITFAVLGPVNGLRYAQAFNKRMAYEANEMAKLADEDDLIFQIEVPGEVAMAHKLPKFMVGMALGTILGLVRLLNPKIPVGIHFCFGDLNNEALVHPKSLEKLVNLSNKLVEKWPSTHKLDFIHYPLAEADIAPNLEASYYKSLEKVQLPKSTRFIAGFVHERLDETQHQQLLHHIESARGSQVDVACSCGLGRRTSKIADDLLNISSKLSLEKY